MQTRIANPVEVPEDVLAEMDIEERRANGSVVSRMPEAVPEEVRSELDHQARLADEEQRLQLAEGSLPGVEPEPTER